MASVNKQQKRAKRAKTKAKENRVARQDFHAPTPIVPDYFMPDLLPFDEEIDNDVILEGYLDPELLETMDDEEREAMAALLRGEDVEMSTEDELLLIDAYLNPAPEPSDEQRITHYEELKQAELEGEEALLSAFTRGPIAAHAFYNIDFDNYDDILVSTLGAYWVWAHGLDEQAVRARIVNDDFYEGMRNALRKIEDESIMLMLSGINKQD